MEAEELEAGIKTMEMKRQISYQTIAKMAKKVRRMTSDYIVQIEKYKYPLNKTRSPLESLFHHELPVIIK